MDIIITIVTIFTFLGVAEKLSLDFDDIGKNDDTEI